MSISSGYLAKPLDHLGLRTIIKKLVKGLRAYPRHFDAIAFRGMSGAMVAPTIAAILGKSMLLVRKPAEETHTLRIVEGCTAADTYVIVDDIVATGETVCKIMDAIQNNQNVSAECVGVATYEDDSLPVSVMRLTTLGLAFVPCQSVAQRGFAVGSVLGLMSFESMEDWRNFVYGPCGRGPGLIETLFPQPADKQMWQSSGDFRRFRQFEADAMRKFGCASPQKEHRRVLVA